MKKKKTEVPVNWLAKQGYLFKVQELDGDKPLRLTVHKTVEGSEHELAIIMGAGHKALVTDILTGKTQEVP